MINENVARKVLETVDMGLVRGMGDPEPGKMCVEAAVCYALGEPHGDNPSCVGDAVRAYKIRLNDARGWNSNASRAAGMRRIAIAQLGSNKIDQKAFSDGVALKTIQRIVPIALRAAGSLIPSRKEALESAAVACEAAIGLFTGRKAAKAAASAAAHAYAAAAYGKQELVLIVAADIGVEVLKDLNCEGTKYLYLCDK